MIKTILVPTSGTKTDDSVFATALGVARPLAAHLDFYHVRLSACEAAVRLPHVQFCVGPAIRSALEDLEQRDDRLSAAVTKHFEEFCSANQVSARGAPIAIDGVTAQRLEETDQAERRLMFHARHRDLVVIGRPHTSDLMPYNLIEVLLMGSGRPIVIAPDAKSAGISGTIVVAWKETPEAARALGAAMPLLRQARRVVLVSVAEQSNVADALDHLARQLKWHGIAAEALFVNDKAKKSATAAGLVETAVNLGADMLVVGGYGHGPLREVVFGGVTHALIEHAPLPVFMMH